MSRVVVLIGTIVVAAAVARADPQTANRAAAEADALGRAKDFLGAAAKFREAYAADPRPDLICNVGVAYYKAQELPRAQLYLSRCLERGSALNDSKFVDTVRATLSRLEATLKAGRFTPVDVVVEPRFATVAIDAFAADETFEGGRTIWLAYGSYHVTVRADGYRAQTVELATKDRAILPLRVSLEREAAVVPPPRAPEVEKAPQPGAPAIGATTAEPDRPPPSPTPPRPSIVPALAVSAATVALASLAIVARLNAGDHAERAGFALDDDSYQTEADGARRWNTIFGVGLAVAGAGAVASGYLWFRVWKAPRSAAPRVEVSQHGASITLGGRF